MGALGHLEDIRNKVQRAIDEGKDPRKIKELAALSGTGIRLGRIDHRHRLLVNSGESAGR